MKPFLFRPVLEGRRSIAIALFLVTTWNVVVCQAPGVQEENGKIAANNFPLLMRIGLLSTRINALKMEGKLTRAVTLAEELLHLIEEESGALSVGNTPLINSLSILGELCLITGEFPKALKVYERALELAERSVDKDPQRVAVALNNLGLAHQHLGRHEKALGLYTEALEIVEKLYGETQPDIAFILNQMAMLHLQLGEFDKALTLSRRAVRVGRKKLGVNRPELASMLTNQGEIHRSLGNYAEALPLHAEALELFKKIFGENHIQTAFALNNLAIVYRETSDYIKAAPLCSQALEIAERTGIETHPLRIKSLNNLAVIHQEMAEYERARDLFLKVLDLLKKVPGERVEDRVRVLNNLGYVYQLMDNLEDAGRVYQEAGPLTEKLGAGHPLRIAGLQNMAGLYLSLNEPDKATPLYRQVLHIVRKNMGEEHPWVAETLNSLAVVALLARDYQQAETLNLQALTIREKAFGEHHPFLANNLADLALLQVALGRPESALDYLRRASDLNEAGINHIFTLKSERDKFAYAYLDSTRNMVTLLLNLVSDKLAGHPEAIHLALETVLRRKGLVLDALSRERVVFGDSDSPELAGVRKALREVNADLAHYYLASSGQAYLVHGRDRFDRLREKREELERKLAALSRGRGMVADREAVTPASVAASLPPGGILLEYVAVDELLPPNEQFPKEILPTPRGGNPIYGVFVLKKEEPHAPRWVGLGDFKTIGEDVRRLRQEIEYGAESRDSIRQIKSRGGKLYQTVFAPLVGMIEHRTTLFISPDGDLNLIPFEVLFDEGRGYLVERYQFNYLSSGRDLIRIKKEEPNRGNMVIFADPDYDLEVSAEKAEGTVPNPEKRTALSPYPFDQRHWPRLPGTRAEADAIDLLFSGSPVEKHLAEDALEHKLKEVRSPRLLHLATHGFFLKTSSTDKAPGQRDLKLVSVGLSSLEPRQKISNPLLRSGLVFAGANHFGKGTIEGEDGILTGLEVSAMDLRGTELVILSACQTGLGQIHYGEGVLGLRRAFHLAGARAVIMSLWSVPDRETKDLMIHFYTGLKSDLSPSKALRTAILQQIKALRRDRGMAHPYYWGAFLSVGKP